MSRLLLRTPPATRLLCQRYAAPCSTPFHGFTLHTAQCSGELEADTAHGTAPLTAGRSRSTRARKLVMDETTEDLDAAEATVTAPTTSRKRGARAVDDDTESERRSGVRAKSANRD
ncbi:hypothetical protein HaLaN_09843 [Haematococcus lacustris]|uniref:Uncharacterized protein n=1 Tax=Haematococcus lacustris TaxID=44745 RepID=A0A699YWC6_HAELA|nr:hypothetical protein HaLaN_09843 [Haematococcus lacustris]